MIELTIEVEGMKCGMCESYLGDVVRRVEDVCAKNACAARSRHGARVPLKIMSRVVRTYLDTSFRGFLFCTFFRRKLLITESAEACELADEGVSLIGALFGTDGGIFKRWDDLFLNNNAVLLALCAVVVDGGRSRLERDFV